MRARWITIGIVEEQDFTVIRNYGFRGGFTVCWAGRVNMFSPWQFASWPGVVAAGIHLALNHGLEVVDWGMRPAFERVSYLRVRVMRRRY